MSRKKSKSKHDGSYRRLFSHPRMVEDLLRRFVAKPWIEDLDFSTLEMVPAHYVSEELEQRESDVVWRLRYDRGGKQEWFYVYILMEFQSTVDRFMGIRLLTYLLLFYQHLIETKQLTSSRKLPPVLPIVLYNGLEPWTAPVQVARLVERVKGLTPYTPHFQYLVIDEGHYSPEELEPLDNPVTAVFQLEQSRGPEEISRIIDSLIEILDDPELTALRRDMVTWLRRVVVPARMPGETLPDLKDLQEWKDMLEQRSADWPKEWIAQGFEQGRESGLREGQSLLLIRQLERKFGRPLPTSARRRVSKADRNQLTKWAEELLDASSIEELFRES